MLTHPENETVLVAEARAGNADAFAALFSYYDKHIYRLAVQITGNREDAEDVLQDTLMKVYTNIRDFRGESHFYTWLVRVAINQAVTKLRKRRSERQVSLDEPVEAGDAGLMPREVEDWGDNPEQRYAKVELQKILAETIEPLEPPLRIVFVLRDVEEISTEETASMLGLSAPAVKSRLLRARLKIRERLNKCFKHSAPSSARRQRSSAAPSCRPSSCRPVGVRNFTPLGGLSITLVETSS